MPTERLENFFLGKLFEIPPYQRDYAWTERNLNELIEDLQESVESRSDHYLGTFVLSKSQGEERHKVVDGQQRLTTVFMLVNVLLISLSERQTTHREFLKPLFIRDVDGHWKLSLLGDNSDFFLQLIQEENPEPSTPSQTRLTRVYNSIKTRVAQRLASRGEEGIIEWLNAIRRLEVLEFIESNEGKAIRMFQTVNDRGVPLSFIDKLKSILIYYSNRLLNQELDDFINNSFGHCFRDFAAVKALAAEPGYEISLVSRATFTEDDVLRYHYLAFDSSQFGSNNFNFNATIDFILNDFMKPELKRLSQSKDGLRAYLRNYTSDLSGFFRSFKELIQSTRDNVAIYNVFVIQNLSAFLYPITIRLWSRGCLTGPYSQSGSTALLDAIETADIRVYKTRGTDPAKDVLTLSRRAGTLPTEKIANELREFVTWFMDDATFRSRLSQDVFQNAGINRMLMEYEVSRRKCLNYPTLKPNELSKMIVKEQTVEHILPQKPTFAFPCYGYDTADEYNLNKDRFGNLTLLEKYLNSRCRDQPVTTKIQRNDLYPESEYVITKEVASAGLESARSFHKNGINERTTKLVDFCLARWPLWLEAKAS